MEKIAAALSTIDPNITSGILDLAKNLSEQEIINLFNQNAIDFFNMAIETSQNLGLEKEFGFGAYKTLFTSALKINAKLPIDKFTIIILEHAPDIYDENEKYFLEMSIPDGEVKVSNAFSIIKSTEFKKLWMVLDQKYKEIVKEHIISLTTYAHAYFYKLII